MADDSDEDDLVTYGTSLEPIDDGKTKVSILLNYSSRVKSH